MNFAKHETIAKLWKEKKLEGLRFAETPYTLKEEVSNTYDPTKHKMRYKGKAELIYEIDASKKIQKEEAKKTILEIQNKNFQKLKEEGYEVFYSTHEGESPYLTIYEHTGLEQLKPDEQKEYAKLFAQKHLEKLPEDYNYDYSLYDTDHYRPIEQQPHWKPEHEGRIHKITDFANYGEYKPADEELLEKAKQPEGQTRKVKLSTYELLKLKKPTMKERGSLVMQLKEGNGWNENQIAEHIAKNNNWEDYDPIQTRKGIETFFKSYANKPNPRKELQTPKYFGVMQFNPTAEINITNHLADGYLRKEEGYVTIPKLCYRIYAFQFGSGLNKKFFLITRPFETKNLGKQELCLRGLLFNEKEDENGNKKEMLEHISYCNPEKQILLAICKEQKITTKTQEQDGEKTITREATHEELLQRILQRHKENKIFYCETPIVPKKQLQNIDKNKWQEILEDFFHEGINKDHIIELTYKSDLIQPNPEVIKNPKYYQPKNSNELVYTNTKTTKSTTATKTSRLLLSARISKLLGFSTAQEVVKGELDNETRVITIDEVQEDKGEELFGLLNNYMEQGKCEIAKGKQSVNVTGYAGLRWQGNPKLSVENQTNEETTGLFKYEEEALHQHFVDSLKIISSNNEAFGGRIGYLVFRLDLRSKKDFEQTKDLTQEQIDKNEALVKAVMQEARTNYSKLYFNQQIIDWHNKPLQKYYTNKLLELERNALLEPIRLFIKGHREQANSHLRGKAFKLACVDHAINIMREETNIKALLEEANEYVTQIQEQNLISFQNLVKISENEEAKKSYLETAYKELPIHLKILIQALLKAKEVANKQVYGLEEITPYFEYPSLSYSEKMVLERITKNMGRTSSQIQKFGISLGGDQKECSVIIQNTSLLDYTKAGEEKC